MYHQRMQRLILAGGVTLILVACLAGWARATVTYPQYHAVKVGWSRAHVNTEFGTTGKRVVMWAGVHGWRHIVKDYPTDTSDTVVEVTYLGRPSFHPFSGPVWVTNKELS